MTPADELIIALAEYSSDPYAFVLFSFPWGEEGTELVDRKGPEPWQTALLLSIKLGLLSPEQAILEAVASGHGVGKSALVAWIILWSISTFEDTRGVVTANTEKQLMTKTWVELDKWYRMFIGRDLFEKTATKICSRDPEHSDSWRIDVIPWSERNTEAFAGLHNMGKRVVVIFDEASAIPDVIWETTEGALTDANTQIVWLVCGNPTRNVGRFKECFPGGRHAHAWHSRAVDSRAVSITNKKQIEDWIRAYGEDSDFVRIRVKGEFPRVGAMEFIPAADVDAARKRDANHHPHEPLIFGVDVARYGDDASVIYIRKGRDARTFPAKIFRGVDLMTFAGAIAELARFYRPDAIFVDGGGVGGGVIDRLRQLRYHVFDIQFGAKADRLALEDDKSKYANKRAEMWGFMRSALRSGLAIPDNDELANELIGPTYGFNARDEIQLESKSDMKSRGLSSPDYADALALTYAYPVMPNPNAGRAEEQPNMYQTEYDPLAYEDA